MHIRQLRTHSTIQQLRTAAPYRQRHSVTQPLRAQYNQRHSSIPQLGTENGVGAYGEPELSEGRVVDGDAVQYQLVPLPDRRPP
eukprot:3644173-Rhodomonas_salina.2